MRDLRGRGMAALRPAVYHHDRTELHAGGHAFRSATMCSMKRIVCDAIILAAFALIAIAPRAAAQGGSIEFVARATPSGGLEEQVRGFPIFLLSKSFEAINADVTASYPMPDMDAFIDKLEISKELKAWMKKHHWMKLTGDDFIHMLHAPDIMDTPEFYEAYMRQNAGDETIRFPKSKAKPADKVKDPAKYEKLTQEYKDAVRHFIEQNPSTIEGIQEGLVTFDPTHQWEALVGKRMPEIKRQVRQLAQSKYFVARTETDLQGQGFFRGIAPGNYWLSSLDVPAEVGDARPRWDVEITVQSGKTAYITLTSVNAIQPASHTAP